ncbi:aminoglycoside phosphotransferase family protein [Fodinibius sediminis]|uniref:Streptomycin 6-kinase n=1 Tax=Fodinibius sediminis TaxID=1214077 RepID=A0A521E648_9BACT|nr:aminoglycoside phosphotransferase family protein [Fodinibius sediminis]SMO79369.1 streptomycin 6-kinase [Fodinibius sediminis]
MAEFPSGFKQRVLELHGSNGQRWFDQLPSLIRSIEKSWNIQVSTYLPSLTYNYVALAETNEGNKTVLKIGVPCDALDLEARSLQFFGGNGAARLLKYSTERGAMLIERIEPGYSITQLDEKQAVKAFSFVIKEIHRSPDSSYNFPTLQDWGTGFDQLRAQFDGKSGPLPPDLMDNGEAIYKDLIESMASPVLLHGDLHHENILAGRRKPWLAIDPKGVIGEPEYEAGAFLRNPLSKLVYEDNLAGLIKNRIDMISEMTGYDKDRMAQWGFAQAVLSAIWSFEDHRSGWKNVLVVARAIQKAS